MITRTHQKLQLNTKKLATCVAFVSKTTQFFVHNKDQGESQVPNFAPQNYC